MSQASSLPESKPVCSQCDALLRGAVGEALGIDPALSLLLDAVVADRRGRGQSLLEVAALQEPAIVGRARPDTGKAVRLQFQPH